MQEQGASKLTSRIVAIVFLIILILPVTYALISHFFFKTEQVKQITPTTEQMTK